MIPRFVDIDPSQVIPIYDNSIAKELAAVVWITKDKLRVYYIDEMETYTRNEAGEWLFESSEANVYNEIQWVITQNNDEHEPTWKCVKTYIDIVNSLQTNTLNALDRHARGTLITSLEQTPELVNSLSHLNAVFDMAKGDDGRRERLL